MIFRGIIFYFKRRIDRGERSFFLYFLSLFFKSFLLFKNFLYRKNFLKGKKVKVPIISIGNIVAGGSGKTPFSIKLLEEFIKRDISFSLVTRGYGRRRRDNIRIDIGSGDSFSYLDIGDEPLLIKDRLEKGVIQVGDKLKSCMEAERSGIDLIVMDDGFQSRYVVRDIDVLMMDAKKPFSNGYFLPCGLLRDDPKRIRDADFVVVNNAFSEERYLECKEVVKRYGQAEVIGAVPKITKISGEIGDGESVAIFSAIGNPLSFFESLKDRYQIVDCKYLLDHEPFSRERLRAFSKRAKERGAKALICTEKDYVKLERGEVSLPVYFARMELKIVFDREGFEKLVSTILKKVYIVREKGRG